MTNFTVRTLLVFAAVAVLAVSGCPKASPRKPVIPLPAEPEPAEPTEEPKFLLPEYIGVSLLQADKPKKAADKPKPIFKPGDNVYLRISGDIPRPYLYLSPKGEGERNQYGTFDTDYLVPFDENMDIRIKTKSGKNHEALRLNCKEVLDELQKKIQSKPQAPETWNVTRKCDDGSITIQFAGVQRFYQIQTINVPNNNALRQGNAYKGGHPPILRLRVVIDGKERACKTSGTKGWDASFGNTDYFEFVLYQDEQIVFYLKDANTTWYERDLQSFPNLTIRDLEKWEILETLDSIEPKEKAIKIKLREVK